MKHISQTLKVVLALFVAIFSNGLLPTTVAYAYSTTGSYDKVYVCKYVGTPGTDEQLQTGQNPIDVSTNAIKDFAGIGSYFNDAQGRSYVVAWDNGDKIEPPVSMCPTPQNTTHVTPQTPTVSPLCGPNNDPVTLPQQTGVNYASTGWVNGSLTVTATAASASYVLDGTKSWTFTDANVECPSEPTPVTPVAPTIYDVCGTEDDTVTLPTTTGISYSRNGSIVTATPLQGYILQADNGYTLQSNGTATYTVTLTNKECDKVTICHRTASVTNPYVSISVDVSSVDGNTGNDKGKGDHYAEHTGPIFPLKGEDGKWGDIIPPVADHASLNWTEEGQAILRNDCNIPVKITVTPGACAYYDTKSTLLITVAGTAKDSDLVVYDASNKVVYSVAIVVDRDGEVTSPTFPVTVSGLAAGTYTVKVLKGEKVLASETATIALCYHVVAPEKPAAVDFCYNDKDKIFIKSIEGVIYKVNGVETSGWVRYEGKALVVTAEAAPGYVLDEEATATWTFGASDFTNKQCLTITKAGKVANDTNHDGVIGVGDTVTWEITVTNTGESKYENFYVTLEDANVTLQDNGYIGYLGAGEHVTLTGTSVLTAKDFQVCKATNTATFFGWRANKSRDVESDSLSWVKSESNPLATASASAEYTLTCPTPGGNILGDGVKTTATPVVTAVAAVATETPATLPATGPSDTSNFFAMIFTMGIAYGATYFIQRRREVATS